MVHSARFELTTYCSGGNRSIQLSYECAQCRTILPIPQFRNPKSGFFSFFFVSPKNPVTSQIPSKKNFSLSSVTSIEKRKKQSIVKHSMRE